MGNLNLLKAGYNGKVGQTYGVETKGAFYIKAVPFSHTPHNNSQNQAKNRFIGLNRIASAVVKKMWNYLSLSDKKMYRNNALCQHWKNSLIGETFKLDNLKEVISQNGALKITQETYNPQNLNFVYSAQETNPDEDSKNQQIYLALVTNRNITKADTSGKGNNLILSSSFNYIDFAYFQVWAFKARKTIKKWQLKGLSISDPIFVIIVNEIFYASRWKWQENIFIQDEIFFLPSKPSYIENEILYIK